MTLREFIEHNEDPLSSLHPMNVIDYKIDNSSGLSGLFGVPTVVADISLAHAYFPQGAQRTAAEQYDARKGLKYLLMSEKQAVTNFHQEVTGSSVCYCLLRGSQNVYIVEPTLDNVAALKRWEAPQSKT